jgi:hypothetical protein
MTSISLGKLIDMLNRELERHHHDPVGLSEEFRKNVVFKGEPNEHLNKDLPMIPSFEEGGWVEFKRILHKLGIYHATRKKNLPFATAIEGDYLLYDYTEKIHLSAIISCRDLADLELKMSSWGGTLNRFSTCQIPIVHGKIRRFELECTHRITGEHHVLHREGVHDEHSNAFDQYAKIEVQWLDDID